jgi:hypothetical protein
MDNLKNKETKEKNIENLVRICLKEIKERESRQNLNKSELKKIIKTKITEAIQNEN